VTAQTATYPSLEIRLFGPLDVRLAGKPLPRLRSRKGGYLLALLALRHGREVPRAWLAGTLWPDTMESRAYTSLRVSLNDLRHALGDQADRLNAPTPQTLLLDLTDATVDVLAFDRAIAGDSDDSLQEAVTLYRGPLLEGCLEEWALQEREAREQVYLTALETLAARAMERGEPRSAEDSLRRLLAGDPLRETALRRLLQALAARGDYAGVTLAYREFRLRLRQHLNADPAPETTALFQRLRDAARRRALQKEPDSPAPTASPSPDGPRAPGDLPRPPTRFVGRESAVQQIQDFLRAGPLVTLTGPGGIGKTRLAIRVAEEGADAFAEGIAFVDLAPLSNPSLVPQALASALGIQEEPGQPLVQTLRKTLRDKQMLLILDNCEHLSAACARLATDLLAGCPDLHLLATSRQPLGVAAEIAWRVPALSLPAPLPAGKALAHAYPSRRQPEPDLESLRQSEAVQLFVERAVSYAPGFSLTVGNAPAIAHLCRRLDGIPLALELAAARLRVLTAEQIADRLDDRFRLLTGGDRAAMPHHRTLRAMMDWSYELLSEPERQLFRRLAVFAGGCTLEAVTAVCLPERQDEVAVMDLLEQLAERSLLNVATGGSGEARYLLLETIRQYALERLQESGEQAAVRRRFFDFFQDMADRAELELAGPEQARWLEHLDREHDNLRAALEGRRAAEKGAVQRLRLAGALWRFWLMRGYLSEGRAALEKALQGEDADERTSFRAKALRGAGVLAWNQGDYAQARQRLEECLAIDRERGDARGIASSLLSLGLVTWNQGDPGAARTLYEESLALQRGIGNQQGISNALTNLGILAYEQGDYATARALYEESLAVDRERGDTWSIASSLHNLGAVAHDLGDVEAARQLYTESLAIHRELGDKRSITLILSNLGRVAEEQEDYARARTLYEETLALQQELGARQGIALSLGNLGSVAENLGEMATARQLYTESLAIHRELGDRAGVASSLNGLGNVAAKQGDYRTARRLYAESLEIGQELESKRRIVVYALEAVAHLEADLDRPDRAARLAAAAQALRQAAGAPRPPHRQEAFDRQLAALRERLGEEAFAVAWAQGEAMPLEQAVAHALETQ